MPQTLSSHQPCPKHQNFHSLKKITFWHFLIFCPNTPNELNLGLCSPPSFSCWTTKLQPQSKHCSRKSLILKNFIHLALAFEKSLSRKLYIAKPRFCWLIIKATSWTLWNHISPPVSTFPPQSSTLHHPWQSNIELYSKLPQVKGFTPFITRRALGQLFHFQTSQTPTESPLFLQTGKFSSSMIFQIDTCLV